MVKDWPERQLQTSIVIVEPTIVQLGFREQVPSLTKTFESITGAGHPAGMVNMTEDPVSKSRPPVGENVKVRVFPVLPYATLVGLTVIAPSPSTAGSARGAAETDANGKASSINRKTNINAVNLAPKELL